jgi:hypothetical protein
LGYQKSKGSFPMSFVAYFHYFEKYVFCEKKLGERCSFNVKCAFPKKTLKLLQNQRMGKIY